MIVNKPCKRLGVFIFYDKDGIVDDYVKYMLDSLKECCDDIIIVSNSIIKELESLKIYTDTVLLRENKGLDAGAFKEVYDQYHASFNDYDELVLLNDTFYGPFKPFVQICDEMANKDLDFWGLCNAYELFNGFGQNKSKSFPPHIQTFFIVFRKTVLESDAFNSYWQTYDINKMLSFKEVVSKHETQFTHYLESHGFKWDTYLQLDHYKKDYFHDNFNIYGLMAYPLLKYYNAPFIKRKNFVYERRDMLYFNDGLDLIKSFEYIKRHTDYDVDIIYRNLIRQYDPISLYHGLNLNYQIEGKDDQQSDDVICIIDLETQKYAQYLDKINYTNIKYITKQDYEGVEKVDSVCQYLISHKEQLKAYKYVFVLQIQETIGLAVSIDECNFFRMIDNSISYQKEIASVFENNPYLNVVLTPTSFHNDYFDYFDGYEHKKFIKKHHLPLGNRQYIPCNKDVILFKSELLDSLTDVEDECIQYEMIKLSKKYLGYAGKVYTKEYMECDINSYENMFVSIFEDCKKHLKYPYVSYSTASVFRKALRKIIPIETRIRIANALKGRK